MIIIVKKYVIWSFQWLYLEFHIHQVRSKTLKQHLFISFSHPNFITIYKHHKNSFHFSHGQLSTHTSSGSCTKIHKSKRLWVDQFALLIHESLRVKSIRISVYSLFIVGWHSLTTYESAFFYWNFDLANCKFMIDFCLPRKYSIGRAVNPHGLHNYCF